MPKVPLIISGKARIQIHVIWLGAQAFIYSLSIFTEVMIGQNHTAAHDEFTHVSLRPHPRPQLDPTSESRYHREDDVLHPQWPRK